MKQKIFLVLTLLSAATFTAQAKIDIQALQACSTIKNDKNRLLCYDKAIVIESSDFGIEYRNINEGKATEVKALISSIKKAAHGELIINLDNNQQWRQINSKRMVLKANDTIVITRGALNSFSLKKYGTNRSIGVKRIK
jgi:hypothetical protein